MSVGELNQLMTYVIDGWMLFSAGFIGIEFVSFVSRRIQEDIEADAVALANQQSAAAGIAATAEVDTTETVEDAVVSSAVQTSVSTSPAESPTFQPPAPPPPEAKKTGQEGDEPADGAESESSTAEDLSVEDAARLEEVAAVSEQLAKTKGKQSDSSSVSVST